MKALRRTPYDTEIVRLAIPALGALAADPLLSLIDTAFVGRLGRVPLAGLGVAAAVFGVAFAVFNFLEYATTPLVARAVGADQREEAGRFVASGVVMGIGLGVATAVVLMVFADPVLRVMGADQEVLPAARTYLSIRALALPAVMVVKVGHGVFRGYQDTKTPMVITIGLNVVNLVLDPLLIFAAGLDLAGAAWATVIAQWFGAGWFLVALMARKEALGIVVRRPSLADFSALAAPGRALVMRTGSLLGALTLATAVAARLGTVPLAAHQVLVQLWIFLALVVDAIAIAGQALVGKAMGEKAADARLVAERLLVLGGVVGVALAAVMAAGQPFLPGWFTDDAGVIAAVSATYWFVVAMQPLNALVFVWDGIVIGAADFGYLAVTMMAAAVSSSLVLLAVIPLGWGLAGVWWGIVSLMLVRAATQAWWHRRGPLASARGSSPVSPAA